jgi:type IX secretion system PorP/SprF family membrane protein
MKDLKKLCFSIFVFVMMTLHSFAQDHMYSQFFNAPLYLNPALTGQFDGDLRMNFIYRNQWSSGPANLSYYTASIDLKIPQFGGGVGLMFTRSSETSALTQNNVSGLYSYSVGSDDFILSFGLQAGVTNRTVNWGNLVFGDQIDPQLGIIPGSTTSAELPQFNNKYYFDSGAGLNLVVGDLMVGTALQHINQPNESFTGSPATLPMRGTAHISYRWDLNAQDDMDDDEKSYVIPSVVFYKQSTAQSLSAGMQYKHKGVNVGLWYRDSGGIDGPSSVVLSFIFDIFINKDSGEKVRLGVDHDMSLSGVNYSNSSGTTEGSLGYETTLPSRTDSYDKFDKSRQCYHFY